MKSYADMIQWVVSNNTTLRYNEWPAVMAIAEIYGMEQAKVVDDIRNAKEIRETALREVRRAKNREDHETRRLANLARKQGEQQ